MKQGNACVTMRALVADADVTNRVRLSVFLRGLPGIDVVSECERGLETVDALAAMRPDIVFLAVDLPEVGGVELLACTADGPPPAPVFLVNGHRETTEILTDEGFSCLAKPFDRQHLHDVVAAAIGARSAHRGELDRRLAAVLTRLREHPRQPTDRIVIRHHGTVRIVPTAEVDWIGAARNYVKLHVGEDSYDLRSTMTAIEKRIDPRRFLRIHRSIIVNTDRIRGVEPWFHGDTVVVLEDGTRLNISRGYRDRVDAFLASLSDGA